MKKKVHVYSIYGRDKLVGPNWEPRGISEREHYIGTVDATSAKAALSKARRDPEWRSVYTKFRLNPSKRKTLKRVGLALKKWIRGNPHSGPKLQIKANWAQSSNPILYKLAGDENWRHTPFQVADARHSKTKALAMVKRWVHSQGFVNPSRVKGRKVKGGRAVTLKNMKSVTITRHSNGAVSVRGVQLKGRKR